MRRLLKELKDMGRGDGTGWGDGARRRSLSDRGGGGQRSDGVHACANRIEGKKYCFINRF